VRLSKELAREHARRGQWFVASPVLGWLDAAAEKRDHRRRHARDHRPRHADLRCIGTRPVGRRRAGVASERSQDAVNFMLAAALEARGEATALIRKSDVEPRVFIEVLNALVGSPVYENYGRMIADRAFEPAGFGHRWA
jgi:3-hydroxyisobutyrate dehydrogenase-like beta-hydroxyacid dehydrogenase